MERILVIEDDTDINKLIYKILVKEGYEVVAAFSGTEGELRLSMDNFDLMVCDLMLPGLSGEDLIRKTRENSILPIIALSAKGSLDDKVAVLELGADDYMTKPFEARELLARVRAQLRRMNCIGKEYEIDSKKDEYISFKDIKVATESMEVTLMGQPLELTPHEFAILQTMMETPKRVFSKEALYESVWKNGYYGEDNTISVHISNIRKKIAKVTSDEYISTVWGIGYKLNL